MEAVTFLLGIASSLIVGVVIGWYGHVLAGRRAKQDRKVGDETERIDRCSQVFGARIEYVIAYHRKGPMYTEIRAEYRALQRRYRWADPEVVLKGSSEWNTYMIGSGRPGATGSGNH